MTVYLLHWEKEGTKPHHYLGHTARTVEERFNEHKQGINCVFSEKRLKDGKLPKLAYIFKDGTRTLEHRLKQLSRHNSDYEMKKWCPICNINPNIPAEEIIMDWKNHANGTGWKDK